LNNIYRDRNKNIKKGKILKRDWWKFYYGKWWKLLYFWKIQTNIKLKYCFLKFIQNKNDELW
jgi:hypothetical protein